MALRSLLVDGPSSVGGRPRARRRELLARVFPDIESYTVLDLGGTAYSWLQEGSVRPKSVTLVNLFDGELTVRQEHDPLPEWINMVVGDACDLPEEILDRHYDLVFSNSLIEHVGGPARRRMLAEQVHATADRHWIRTPYRYFPVEPHWLFPLFQFLPLVARAWLSRVWPLVPTRATTWDGAVSTALDTELLTITELRHLFPGSTVHRERFLGLTTSVVLVRQ